MPLRLALQPFFDLRKKRDSNPREPINDSTGFRNRRFQPLSHLSFFGFPSGEAKEGKLISTILKPDRCSCDPYHSPRPDLNRRPQRYECCALPLSYKGKAIIAILTPYFYHVKL